ncbi:DMT family transporter [Mesorhizobium waimense]|uniref:DMT family transporter n=1 Tax=Mesorhizobium waimense TaxID=1300307 RepID=UPI001FE1D8B7
MSKLLIGSIDPWLLAGILSLGAGCGLTILHGGRRLIGLPSPEASLRRADLPWLAAVVIFGGVLGPLLLMLGLSMTSASAGSLLLNVEGLATMVIAWVIFRENVDLRLLFGAVAILAGAVLLSWTGDGFRLDAGSLLVVAACVNWGIDNNLTRKLSASDPVQIAMIKGLVAGTTNLVLALAVGASLPSATLFAAGVIAGFLGVGVSLVMFMLALRHLGTARTGAYFSLAPFIGAVLALALFREPITGQLAVAAALMGIGLWLHLRERHEHEHAHDPIEHDHLHTHDEHHDHHHEGPVTEPHSHWHRHAPLRHSHAHYPDLHHRHGHRG